MSQTSNHSEIEACGSKESQITTQLDSTDISGEETEVFLQL